MGSLLHTSGGNALLAALASCDQVVVYGSGLFGTRSDASSDKRYVHYYDKYGVEGCANSTRQHAMLPLHTEAKTWLRDRVTHEALLHTLHAIGALIWVQE